ncbi:MAG: sigma-70 family RNA polymerase sigma factor [Verrucomicrobia bacterium]|nr:sigma-70 family RNA polymerase sigma factor [Verrucomicrobiota bacterium]
MISPSAQENVTQLLLAGTPQPEQLAAIVYDELRAIARRYLERERAGHTLQATALVHEAYVRLVDETRVSWQNRAHFLGVAAQVMRRVLVDYARAHRSLKRGGTAETLVLEDQMELAGEESIDLVALDDALRDLAAIDPRQSQIVELRFFGGLTVAETAHVLDISPRTIKREWRVARAWLRREIFGEPHGACA